MGMDRNYPETVQELIGAIDAVMERMAEGGAPDHDFNVVCLVTALLRELQAIDPTVAEHALIKAVSVMRAAEVFSMKMRKGGAR